MRVLGLLVLVALFPLPGTAHTLEAVLDARGRLGPAVWSRVLRIHNDRPEGPYPAELHALVFELGGVLWFYCPTDGTQSFSLHRGRLAEEKADLAPLLQDIEPGFRWHEDLTEALPGVRRAGTPGALPNGCFIECVAVHLQRWASGREPAEARLLTFYVRTRVGLRGHTLLVFREGGQDWIFDPFADDAPRRLSRGLSADAMTATRELVPFTARRRIAKAVFLDLAPPVGPGPETPRAPVRIATAPELTRSTTEATEG